jgi:hemolysin activation/secretion protein
MELRHSIIPLWLAAGLVVSAAAAVAEPAIRFSVARFEVTGDNPLSAAATAARLAPYLGEHTGIERLQAATSALEDAMRESGHAFYRVVLPPQSLGADGVIRLQVAVIPLGKVLVEGNQHFAEENIRASVPQLVPGRSPNVLELSRTLSLANAHPNKKIQVGFTTGDDPGTVDAHVQVEDQPVHQLFTWFNNTGSAETGRTRLGIGYQHGNVFDRDHALSLSYTTSPEKPSQVSQYGVNYTIPFYAAGGSLNLLFAKSDVNTGTIGDFFNVSGAVTYYSARYTHFFTRRKEVTQSLAVGLEDKFYKNTVDFAGSPLGVDVAARPITLTYSGKRETPELVAGWSIGLSANIPGGAYNDNATYQASRTGADANWTAWRYGASLDYPRGGWLLRALFDGQYATEPHTSGEQFGLGGATSVRGFEEREVSGDRGYRFSFEFWAPPLEYNIRPLAFFEGGEARRLQAQPAEVENERISSAGVGLRWVWRQQLSLSADVGYVLNGVDRSRTTATQDDVKKLHFSLFYKF